VDKLTEMALSLYEWTNLPETIEPVELERILFCKGKALFFQDEVTGYLVMEFVNNGVKLDYYREPVVRRAYCPYNDYQGVFDSSNSVIIYNNMIREDSERMITNFALRLADIERSIDINAKAQKTPVFLQCEESQRLTIKNLYMKYDGNAPYIFGDKNLAPDSVKVLNTAAPYVADKLYQLKTEIWNEALTYLGIPSVNITKKERLITDEVLRSQGGSVAASYSALYSRQRACEKINKMFGLNISVDKRDMYKDVADTLPLDEEGE
jgi:hypothetical protein